MEHNATSSVSFLFYLSAIYFKKHFAYEYQCKWKLRCKWLYYIYLMYIFSMIVAYAICDNKYCINVLVTLNCKKKTFVIYRTENNWKMDISIKIFNFFGLMQKHDRQYWNVQMELYSDPIPGVNIIFSVFTFQLM